MAPRLSSHDFGKVGRTGAVPGQRTGLGGNDSPGRTGRGDESVLIMRDTMRPPVDERHLGEHRRQSKSGQSGAGVVLAAAWSQSTKAGKRLEG